MQVTEKKENYSKLIVCQEFDVQASHSLKSSASMQPTDRMDPTGKSTSMAEVKKAASSSLDRAVSEEDRRKRAELAAQAAERYSKEYV